MIEKMIDNFFCAVQNVEAGGKKNLQSRILLPIPFKQLIKTGTIIIHKEQYILIDLCLNNYVIEW